MNTRRAWESIPSATGELAAQDKRIFSHEECNDIFDRVLSFARGGGQTYIQVVSWWNGELRWARNRVRISADRRDQSIFIIRALSGGRGHVSTNQWDSESLESAVRIAEREALSQQSIDVDDIGLKPAEPYTVAPTIWSDATYQLSAETRGALAGMLVEESARKKLLSAGYLEVRGVAVAQHYLNGDRYYYPFTQAQCSATVRYPDGTGSGWAGRSGYDWASIDSAAIVQRALSKCEASHHPVRIEPGRYTVILEPQATADFVGMFWQDRTWERAIRAERGIGPFALEYDPALGLIRTKLGLKVMDERVTLSHDVMDPALGVVPFVGQRAVTWVKNGVLQTLEYGGGNQYAVPQLGEYEGKGSMAFRMQGGNDSIEAMIEGTPRGLLVSRFSDILVLDRPTVLCAGFTRDGLWLIERGKITKAVQNMRFTESPLFSLNRIEQLSPAVPVFRPVKNPGTPNLTPAIVPAVKTYDFSFTSTIDAI